MEHTVALYSLYRFCASELVDTLDRDYIDDLDALDAARSLCKEHTVEVYDATRFVARVNKGDAPVGVHDGPSSQPQQLVDDAMRRVDEAAQGTGECVHRS